MSKLAELKIDLALLDAESQPSPAATELAHKKQEIDTAIDAADAEHVACVEALQEQIKFAVSLHKSRRDALMMQRNAVLRSIENETKAHQPRMEGAAKFAQAIERKYKKPLRELRDIVKDLE